MYGGTEGKHGLRYQVQFEGIEGSSRRVVLASFGKSNIVRTLNYQAHWSDLRGALVNSLEFEPWMSLRKMQRSGAVFIR